MFKVGDRVKHLDKGMSIVVCTNSSGNILLKLDKKVGHCPAEYSRLFKTDGLEPGNWYWCPLLNMCELVSRKSFKGNLV